MKVERIEKPDIEAMKRALKTVLDEAWATLDSYEASLKKVQAEPTEVTADPEPLLSPKQVAELLGVKLDWVYAHQAELGGRKFGRRTLRFSRKTVLAYGI